MKKKLLLLFLFAILFIISTEKIYASTDINTFTIDVEATTGVASSLNINVNGEFEENTLYYAMFVDKDSIKPTDIPKSWHESIKTDKDNIESWKTISSHGNINISDDWYLLNGYDYVYILKCNKDSCNISNNPIKIEKPALPELSKRYQIYFFSDDKSLSIFPYFPYMGKNGAHKLDLKIGIITDENLLYKIYKNEAGALENLMDYAKNNSGSSYLCDDINCNDLSFQNLNINNGSYYYLYTTYENKDGIYRDLSDISIAQAINGTLSNDINWNFNKSKDDTTIKNPKTSDVKITLVMLGILVMGMFVILGYKKVKKKG